MWYRRGEEPFMHIHTNFERNWMNNFNFTAHVGRAGSSKSDNFTAETHWSHTHIVQRRESIPCGATTCLYAYPHAVYQSLDPDLGQSVPLFMKESPVETLHVHKGTWWPHEVLILVTGQSCVVWSVCRKLWNCHFLHLTPSSLNVL